MVWKVTLSISRKETMTRCHSQTHAGPLGGKLVPWRGTDGSSSSAQSLPSKSWPCQGRPPANAMLLTHGLDGPPGCHPFYSVLATWLALEDHRWDVTIHALISHATFNTQSRAEHVSVAPCMTFLLRDL